MRLAVLLAALWPSLAAADCLAPDMVGGWLKSQGYALSDWGVQAGEMHELYVGERGWAVIATTPDRCARVVSLPDAPKARLSEPRHGDGGVNRAPVLHRGEGT